MRTYQRLVLRILIDPNAAENESKICGSMQRVDQQDRLTFSDWGELRAQLQSLVRQQQAAQRRLDTDGLAQGDGSSSKSKSYAREGKDD